MPSALDVATGYRARVDAEYERDDDDGPDSEFRESLNAGRFEEARALAEQRLSDPTTPRWLVTSMLEDVGLTLAHAGRHDESIAAFERALEVGWDVVPDGRCEIARVLLLAGRDAQADALWAELRAADAEGVWTLNAGGLAYNQVGRDEEAVEWLTDGLRVALANEDPEHVVNQMSDARRLSLRRLGREQDELEREVDTFRARAAVREEERMAALRGSLRRSGIPVRRRPVDVAWVSDEDERTARERWPGWVTGLVVDEPFAERAARMEFSLRQRRADGDGPFVVVTIDLERYTAWCEGEGHDPADRRSRGTFFTAESEAGGRPWPPGRNEPCWCGSERKYKRCCGGLPAHDLAGAGV
jgi:tetratricopeptide (TPR) repeat protein